MIFKDAYNVIRVVSVFADGKSGLLVRHLLTLQPHRATVDDQSSRSSSSSITSSLVTSATATFISSFSRRQTVTSRRSSNHRQPPTSNRRDERKCIAPRRGAHRRRLPQPQVPIERKTFCTLRCFTNVLDSDLLLLLCIAIDPFPSHKIYCLATGLH